MFGTRGVARSREELLFQLIVEDFQQDVGESSTEEASAVDVRPVVSRESNQGAVDVPTGAEMFARAKIGDERRMNEVTETIEEKILRWTCDVLPGS